MDKIIEQRHRYIHCYNQQEGIYQKIIQKAGMAEVPYRILFAVCEEDKKWSQADICQEWNYAKQSVNTAITKLVKQGYVVLIPDKTVPRNRKNIELTAKGEAFCDCWIRPIIAAEIKAFAALSEEERELSISLREKRYEIIREELKELLEITTEDNADE